MADRFRATKLNNWLKSEKQKYDKNHINVGECVEKRRLKARAEKTTF